MPDLLLTTVEYSGYISITKFIIFLILLFIWLPLISWVHQDAKDVGTDETLWTALLFGAGAAASIIWLVMPLFIIGMLVYLITVGATFTGYVMHRNARVMEFDRVLTVDHIKGLFINEEKKLDSLKNLLFITANNNEVPLPVSKTPDFFGYKAAYDIFTDAIWRRASNIVFTPTQQNYNAIYYVDGAAIKQPTIPAERMEYFTHFIKGLADLDTEEKRKPQKGKFRINQNKNTTEWEVATAGSTAGEQIQLKQITQQNLTKLTDINLTDDQHQQLNKIREAKQGLFIISGPKNSGVTTTFYAMLRNHDPFIYSINTLEKQISAELVNITQTVFGLSDTGTTTYAKKLQQVVRTEPDVVGVTDCQDPETAQIASAATRDGKIVYVTLQAENLIQALGKWRKLVGDRNLVAQTLLGISNQRLLRKLCNECKQGYEPNRELLRKFNIPPEKAKVLYRVGKVQTDRRGKPIICRHCQGTGFVGRIGIFEIITINDPLRAIIRQSESLSEISTQFRRTKMLYLQEQAMKKVVDGTTAINEIVRVFSSSKKRQTKKSEQNSP